MRARLYVSISPDLRAEREVIGRAVAALPVDVGWEVDTTPGPLDPAGDPQAATRAHVYALVMGEDIRAPMGVEWTAARRGGSVVVALLKDGPRTPAAHEFVKTTDVAWQGYKAAGEVGAQVQRALAQMLLDHGREFELKVMESQALADLVKTLAERQADEGQDARSGAGQGGVIFAPSREAGQGGIEIGRPGL